MSLKNLLWNLTSDGKRPLQDDQRKWDKDKQEFVPVIPRKSEILCLCKYVNEENPFIMKYNLDIDGWVDTDSEYTGSMPFDKVEKWYLLSDIDDYLEGKPEPMHCWEFGWYTAKRSIPALETWIKDGVSHPVDMEPEKWREILTQIKTAFEISLSDLDGGLDDISDKEERKRVYEEHKQIRKEAFALMAEYYLDLWD